MKISTLAGVLIIVAILFAGAYIVLQPSDEVPEVPVSDNSNDIMLEEEIEGISAQDLLENSTTITQDDEPINSTDSAVTTTEEIKVININDDSYSPTNLTIPVGTTVSFLNNGQAKHWPAGDNHPTHTIYPGSDIKKCGGSEASTIFDACRGLETGEQYSFTFTEPGSWSYHDHLLPKLKGTITVTE